MRKTIFFDCNAAGGEQLGKISGRERAATRHYVYIVECSDGSLYTGYTTDPARRVSEHNSGSAARYTRSRRPVKLVFLEALAGRGEALARELRIKGMSKKEKLLLCQGFPGKGKHGWR